MFSVRIFAIGASIAAVSLFAAISPAPAQVATGASLFKQRCQACHSVAASGVSGVGPNLRGVVGRKAGANVYNYSKPMKASALVLNKANLDKYLAAPTKMVPGTKMVISVTDAAQRKLIIDYLTTQK
jgi:cytochrome c